jgi:16S rRNA (guanine966-N2)-methyltransferase
MLGLSEPFARPMRITGGMYRSRALRAVRGQATRPTSDRVREALFGILASAGALEGARVLDLYAGTGALALEALSRGAAAATLVESSPDALSVERANIEALGVKSRAHVVAGDVHRALPRLAERGPFDLVLADPPWSLVEGGGPPRALSALASAGALSEAAWVVLEHAARTPAPDASPLIVLETRRYGDTALTFYKIGILPSPRSDVAAGPPSD